MIKNKPYKVRWQDITNNNVWISPEDILDEVRATKPQQHVWYYVGSAGIWRLFSSGKINENGEYPDYYAIPKGCIIKISPIR